MCSSLMIPLVQGVWNPACHNLVLIDSLKSKALFGFTGDLSEWDYFYWARETIEKEQVLLVSADVFVMSVTEKWSIGTTFSSP